MGLGGMGGRHLGGAFHLGSQLGQPGAGLGGVGGQEPDRGEGDVREVGVQADQGDLPRREPRGRPEVHGGPGAPGGISHWVTETDEGLMVCDAWESKEIFEKFAEEQIGPYTAEVGIPGPPEITFYDVQNYLTAGSPVAGAAA